MSKQHSIQVRDLSPGERRLLVEWNDTRRKYRHDICFHQLFEAQVAHTPERVAADYYGQKLTYRELDDRAERWARALQGLGVGPEVLVGVAMEPSLELLVALLSVLKAGGAYVPLDPNYPPKRLAFMLEDAALPIVIAGEAAPSRLNPGAARMLTPSLLDSGLTRGGSLERTVSAENLAYVIYTSGSTGKPKGAMITHRGLVNYLTWAVEAYEVSQGTGAPVNSSVSFDLTVTALYTPLLVGGCVTLLSSTRGVDGLCEVLKRKPNFSLVKITPAHLDLLRYRLAPGDLSGSTRCFVIGGEALTAESLQFWQEHAPGIKLVNEYGPTETVVGCCVYFVPILERLASSVPIGRPIANTQLYVLDPDLHLAPVGAEGELFIGGDGVGRGYLNRSALTAERFIANPFVREDHPTSPRLYRTGDRVRYRVDGNLEFLGRIDHQVKINGYRIETGEIEAVLVTHPQVKSAAVMARQNFGGDRYLAAYLVADERDSPPDSSLRTFLRQALPEYMIPSSFVRLSELPLTPNGKVDRDALPNPEAMSEIELSGSKPPDPVQCLMEIWERLLGRRAGPNDNFFELGGTSLLAVRLVMEVNRVFQRELRSIIVYEKPTIRQLALALEGERAGSGGTGLLTVHPGKGGRAVFVLNISSEVFGLVPRLRDLPESFLVSHVPWDRAVLQASARREMSVLPLLPEIAAPHTAHILQSQHAGPCVLVGFSYGGPLAFEVAHQIRKLGRTVDGVILLDADLRIPFVQRGKRWARRVAKTLVRHTENTWRQGVGYLYRLARERRQATDPSAQSSGWDSPLILDAADEVIPWEIVDRIWTRALRAYHPRRLPCRGVLIRADQTWYTSGEDYDGCLGWKGLFTHGLATIRVPGDHFTMWQAPHSERLASELIRALQELGPVLP